MFSTIIRNLDVIEHCELIGSDVVDTVITDCPYEISFMNKAWDSAGVSFDPKTWEAILKVTKPGGMLLCFGGTRTYHRITCAIEDAGWQIRDCLMWLYGTGFPKSHNISKGIDKAAGAEREVVGPGRWNHVKGSNDAQLDCLIRPGGKHNITASATDSAKEWDGWGTALKPAWEPIVLAMKPTDGTFADNAITHGVAGLNIDGCRIRSAEILSREQPQFNNPMGNVYNYQTGKGRNGTTPPEPQGRWPANLILDEEIELSNGASRFFYTAKASKSERGKENNHPTVKPLSLMMYLVKLTKTATGGLVFDPFCGSGSTALACILEGRDFIGGDADLHSCEIAEKRIKNLRDKEPFA